MRASATSRISTAHAAQQAAPGVAANNKADDSSPFAMLLAATATTKDAGDQKPSMDSRKDPSASQQPQTTGTDTQAAAATPQTEAQAQPADKPAKATGKSDDKTANKTSDGTAAADLAPVDPSTLPQMTAALQPPPAPLQNAQPQTPPADDSADGIDTAIGGAARPAAPQATTDANSDTDTDAVRAPQAAAATDMSASSDTAAAKPAASKPAPVTTNAATAAATDSKSTSAKSTTVKSADAQSADIKSAVARAAVAKASTPQAPAADTDSDTSTDESPAPQATAAAVAKPAASQPAVTADADSDTGTDEAQAPAAQTAAAGADTSVKTAAAQPAPIKTAAAKPETGKSDTKGAPLKATPNRSSDARDATAKTTQDAADPNAVPAAKPAPQAGPAAGDANTPAPPAIAAQSSVPQGPAAATMPALTQHIQVSAQPQPNMPALAVEITAKSQAGAKQFDIRLDPPELGRVEVRLSIDATGKASAHLTADQPQTLDLLRKDSTSLTQALRDAGLDVNQNGLNFSLRQQAGDTHQGQNGGGNRSAAGRGQMLTASKSIDATQASAAYRAPADGRLDIRV